jgi:starch synthase
LNAQHTSTQAAPLRVLFVASEAHPLIKTGGLGDVAGSLPQALIKLGCDVRILLPAYPTCLEHAGTLKPVAKLNLPGGLDRISLLAGRLPGTRVKLWLVDYPPAFNRPGNPYLDAQGRPWDDNAERYALLARVAVAIAQKRAALAWHPEVVHCHDWQTGLVPALLAQESNRPASVFTIHNLAYQGLFPHATFVNLGLPPSLWAYDALEFHGQLSFIKGGLVYADKLTTVSPTYTDEIQTPEFGCGLDGLLRHRAADLSGIINGIDVRIWNPSKDPHLTATYSPRRLTAKADNKLALQRTFHLPESADIPLVGMVGRLVEQKGIDQVMLALPALMQRPLQIVILGSGEAHYEQALQAFAARHAEKIRVRIGYDEALAHQIEGGADMFLMPSRFEPCGLNQLYSLRYGTLPVVRRVGGLADTVVDANAENLAAGSATGVSFDGDGVDDLLAAMDRALTLYQTKATWKQLIHTGMTQNFSWDASARHYLDLYTRIAQRT